MIENPMDLENLNEIFRNDKEIILRAVKSDGFALEFASEDLKNDRKFASEAIKITEVADIYLRPYYE